MHQLWFVNRTGRAKEYRAARSYVDPLQQLLSGAIGPEAAVTHFDAIPFHHGDCSWALWNLVFDAAAVFPETHSALVSLLLKAQELSQKQHAQPGTIYEWISCFGSMWGDKYSTFWAWRDGSHGPARMILEEEPQAIRLDQKWINFNAFSAKLAATPFRPRSGIRTEGVLRLREVLEIDPGRYYEEHAKHKGPGLRGPILSAQEKLGCDVSAAAQWVIHAGQVTLKAYDDADASKEKEKVYLPAKTDLWDGDAGMSLGRWNLWKTRFQFMADFEDLSVNVRTVAKEAAQSMDQIAP